MIKSNKKPRGVETLKAKYGLRFCIPWIIGIILFFLYPLVQSVIYIFSEVTLVVGGMKTEFIGIDNIKEVLLVDSVYTNNLGKALASFAYSFPLILVLSMILGILLNQKFIGRIFFRAMYFLPVIIASGIVMNYLFTVSSTDLTSTGTDASVRDNMISVSTVIEWLGLPNTISNYINVIVSKIMTLVWSCGVQIILFISGMQAIPDLLYEVAKVEGATKWEEFWFITFPSLGRVTVLVAVYTMIDLISANSDLVMRQAMAASQRQSYGEATVMIWIYFLIIGALLGGLLLCFNKFCLKRWN